MKRFFKRVLQFFLKLLIGFIILTVALVILYRFVNPPITGMMLYKLLNEKDYSYDHQWKNLEDINPKLPLSFMAAEDQRFFEHFGIDTEAIEKAIEHNKNSNNKHGASTITQQVAKNVFLFPTKSFLRKGFEVYFTLLIEIFWSKCRILEVYANVVELGPGVYGVEYAAKTYFGRTAKNVNSSQAALMAASLPNPNRYRISNPSAYMQKRQNWILRQMSNLGQVQLNEICYN